MANLIGEKDVLLFSKTGRKVYVIEEKTIITPSAKDAAKAYGIEFSTDPCQQADSSRGNELNADLIYAAMKSLSDKGLLDDLFPEDRGC